MRVFFAPLVLVGLALGCGAGTAESSGPATGTVAPYSSSTTENSGTSSPPPAPGDKSDPSPSSPAPMPQKSDPSPSKGSENVPTPSQVCGHLASVLQQELAAAGAPPGAGGTDPECVKKAESEKQKDPKGYACDAACIVAAKDFAGIQACKGKC